MFKGNQPGCGDKPAVTHFIFLTELVLRLYAIETFKKSSKAQRNLCNMRASTHLQQQWYSSRKFVLSGVQEKLGASIEKHRVPGATIAVYHRGRISEAAAGILNVDTKVKTTADSLFQVGSITKLYTATIVMQLVDEGLIDLDQPMKRYLPKFAVNDRSASEAVTVRQILSHSSGIDGDFVRDTGRGSDAHENYLELCADLPQLFTPGTRFSYCNAGYAILAVLVQAVTGHNWASAVTSGLIHPLELNHTVLLPEDSVRYRVAVNHKIDSETGDISILQQQLMPYCMMAAGSTTSASARDVVAFTRPHLTGGNAHTGTAVLTARSTQEMQCVHIQRPSGAVPTAQGLGWTVDDSQGKIVLGHDGGTYGQLSFLRVVPEDDLAVVLLTNSYGGTGVFKDIVEGILSELSGLNSSDPQQKRQLTDIDVSRYVGIYQNMNTRIEIKLEACRLVASIVALPDSGEDPMTQKPTTLEHYGAGLFLVDLPGSPGVTRLQFELDRLERASPFAWLGDRAYRRVA